METKGGAALAALHSCLTVNTQVLSERCRGSRYPSVVQGHDLDTSFELPCIINGLQARPPAESSLAEGL